ncbi:MAG: hypothetical protein AAFZ07_25520 [Actinomycetota bacterium]
MHEQELTDVFGRLRAEARAVDVTTALQVHERRRRTAGRLRAATALGAVAAVVGVLVATAAVVGGDDQTEDVRAVDGPTTTAPSTTTVTTTGPSTTELDPGAVDAARLPEVSRIVSQHGAAGPERTVQPHAGPPGTAGSGCDLGVEPVPPDGAYYVEVAAAEQGSIVVEVLCFFTTTSVSDAGVDRSFEDWEVERRDGPTRSIPVADGAPWFLRTVPVTGPGESSQVVLRGSAAEALAFSAARADPAGPLSGWMLVEDGELVEFYQPQLSSA